MTRTGFPLSLLLATVTTGCLDSSGVRSLDDFGYVVGEVQVSTEMLDSSGYAETRPQVELRLDTPKAINGCYTLEPSVTMTVDGAVADVIHRGQVYVTDQDHEECWTPFLGLTMLPPPTPTSTLMLSDDSSTWKIVSEGMLVNPTVTVGELAPDTDVVATVADTRHLGFGTRIGFGHVVNGDYDPEWDVSPDIVGNELHFHVPATATGSGTLMISLELDGKPSTCIGFDECHVVTYGHAEFERTIQ